MGLRQDDKASGLNLLDTPPGFRKEPNYLCEDREHAQDLVNMLILM